MLGCSGQSWSGREFDERFVKCFKLLGIKELAKHIIPNAWYFENSEMPKFSGLHAKHNDFPPSAFNISNEKLRKPFALSSNPSTIEEFFKNWLEAEGLNYSDLDEDTKNAFNSKKFKPWEGAWEEIIKPPEDQIPKIPVNNKLKLTYK